MGGGEAAGRASAMADGGEDAPEGAPPDEPGPMRQCGESILDCFAFFTRGAVATGRCTYRTTARVTYPVKEATLACANTTSSHFTPYRLRQPANASVPSFQYGYDT